MMDMSSGNYVPHLSMFDTSALLGRSSEVGYTYEDTYEALEDLRAARSEIARLTAENEGLKASNKEWAEKAMHYGNQIMERDAYNAKLRTELETAKGDLGERDAKIWLMDAEIAELKSLHTTSECVIAELRAEIEQYRKAEAEGLLVKLPCKIGDTVFRIDAYSNLPDSYMQSYIVESFVICNNGEVLVRYDSYDGVICEAHSITDKTPYLDYFLCFLTRAEAEAVLSREEERNEQD